MLRHDRKCGFWLCAAVVVAAVLMMASGGCSRQKDEGARPPTSLPELATPDISGLEPVVQEQIKAAREELAADPNNATANGRLGMMYQLYELPDAAAVMYRRAGQLDPKAHRWHFHLGHCLSENQKLDQAVEALREAVKIKPDFVPGWNALGFALIDTENFGPAREAFEKARELKPLTSRLLFGFGLAYLRDGKAEQAIEPLRLAANLSPRAGMIHRALAEAYEKLGQADRAARERILECSPVAMPALECRELEELPALATGSKYELRRADNARIAGRFASAIAHADKAIEFAPKSVQAHVFKAGILLATGKPDEALDLLRRTVEIAPDDPRALCGLADVLSAVGKPQEASDLYHKALDVDAKWIRAHVALAELLASQGDLDAATEHLNKVFEINAAQLDARVLMVNILLSQGKKDEALAELERMVADRPAHAWSHFVLARLYHDSGVSDRAIRHWQSTIEAEPLDTGAYLALGQLYLQKGQHGLVDELLQTGLGHMPDAPNLLNALAWLRATCPDPLYRNAKEAVTISLDLCKKTDFKYSIYMDTLAAAYAEAEDFEAAVEMQQTIINMLSARGEKPAPGFLERLALYQAGKKYRDTHWTDAPKATEPPKAAQSAETRSPAKAE